MPRNPAGTYTLPNGPVAGGTTILASDENTTRDDIATELTDSLSRSGAGGMLAPFRIMDGTQAVPGLAFNSDVNTGIFRDPVSPYEMSFAVNSMLVMGLSEDGAELGSAKYLRILSGSGVLPGAGTGLELRHDPTVGGLIVSIERPASIYTPLQIHAKPTQFMIDGNTIATINLTGLDLHAGTTIRARAGVTGVPLLGGPGIEMYYDNAGTPFGSITSIDRTTATAKPLRLTASKVDTYLNGVLFATMADPYATFHKSIFTGSVGNNGMVGFARASDGAAVGAIAHNGSYLVMNEVTSGILFQLNGVTHARIDANGLNWGAYSPGAYPNVGYIPMRTVDGVLHQIACIA